MCGLKRRLIRRPTFIAQKSVQCAAKKAKEGERSTDVEFPPRFHHAQVTVLSHQAETLEAFACTD